MSDNELLSQINEKLDVLIGLSASRGKEEDQQIDILTSLGYGYGFISRIVGLAPDAVRMRISRRKKSGSRRT